jgi:hypothetical protein
MLQQRKMRKYRDGESGDDIIKDGEVVHVPLMLMDGLSGPLPPLLHRPGQVRLSDAQIDVREQALAARSARLKDAWKQGSPLASSDDDDMFEIASHIAPMLGITPPKRNVTRSPMDADPDANVDPGTVDPRQAALDARNCWKTNAWKKTSARR